MSERKENGDSLTWTDVCSMQVQPLRQELRKYGLDDTGIKRTLQHRLKHYIYTGYRLQIRLQIAKIRIQTTGNSARLALSQASPRRSVIFLRNWIKSVLSWPR